MKKLIALLILLCMLPVCAWAEAVTVTYVANNGTDATVVLQKETGVYFDTLGADYFDALAGQKFYCWLLQTPGSIEQIEPGSPMKTDHTEMTLTADWVDVNVEMLSVTVDLNGGTLVKPAPGPSPRGKDAVLPPYDVVQAPEDKEFYGWEVDGVVYPGGGIYKNLQKPIVIKAVWVDASTKIAEVGFHSNGGTGTMNAAGVELGAAYTLPQCEYTAPAGMRFKCWNVKGVEYAPGKEIVIEDSLTIMAVWETTPIVYYTITFESEENVEGTMAPVSVAAGSKFKLPECGFTAPEGDEFWQWYVFGRKNYNVGDEIEVNSDIRVIARWTVRLVSLTYQDADGNNTGHGQKNVQWGQTFYVYTPEDIGLKAPQGKRFGGWKVYNTDGTEANVTAVAGGEILLTDNWLIRPVWVEIETTSVSFDVNGGSGAMNPASVETGTMYTLPACSFKAPDYYTFKCWQINGVEYAAGSSILVNGAVTAKAVWERIQCKITFDGNGALGSMETVIWPAGEDYTLPQPKAFDNEGFAFGGWLVGNETYMPNKTFKVTGNVTVIAQWTTRMVTLRYQDADGNDVMETEPVEYGTAHTVLTPQAAGLTVPEGKQFAGWKVYNNRGGEISETAIVGQPFVLYSDWLLRPVWETKKYTVSVDANGGTGTMSDVLMEHGVQYTVPVCSLTAPKGHYFDGWTLDGAAIAVGEKIKMTKDITLKANWKKSVYTVIIKDSNNAASAVSERMEYGTQIELPACAYTATSEYHSFAYWKVEGAQGVAQLKPGATVTVESDITISAIWDFDDSVKTRVEQVENIENLPPAEKAALEQEMLQEMPPALQTIEAVVEELGEQVEESGFVQEQVEVHEVKLMFKPADSEEWIEATVENFPTAGIEVRRPLPEGTDAANYEFLVIHMFTAESERLGTKPGKTETIVPTIVGNELVFTLNGLSPVSIAWKEKAVDNVITTLPKTGDASCLMGWITLLGASGLGLKAIKRRKK